MNGSEYGITCKKTQNKKVVVMKMIEVLNKKNVPIHGHKPCCCNTLARLL